MNVDWIENNSAKTTKNNTAVKKRKSKSFENGNISAMSAKIPSRRMKKTFTLVIVSIKYVSIATISKYTKTSENAQIATNTTRSTASKNTNKAVSKNQNPFTTLWTKSSKLSKISPKSGPTKIFPFWNFKKRKNWLKLNICKLRQLYNKNMIWSVKIIGMTTRVWRIANSLMVLSRRTASRWSWCQWSRRRHIMF